MLSNYEDVYAGLVSQLVQEGCWRQTRNSETLSLFGKSFSVKSNEIPLLSGRRIHYKGVLGELAAMLRGPKHIEDFERFGCNFWESWANEDGSIEVDYGTSWLDFNGYNQLEALKDSLTKDPMSRRHIISGWRPDRLEELSLPCCHLLYQWYVTNELELEMIWYQRSVDVMIGLPSNVILATTWNTLLANELGFTPGKVHFMLGDCHIYKEHLDGAHQYLANVTTVGEWEYKYLPSSLTLSLTRGAKTEEFLPEQHSLNHYDPLENIKFPLIP